MKHAKHAIDCLCRRCTPHYHVWESSPPPIFAYAYFQPWNYPETHARHQMAEP